MEERGVGGLTNTAEKSKCRLKIKKVGITEAKGGQHFKREGMDNTVKGSQQIGYNNSWDNNEFADNSFFEVVAVEVRFWHREENLGSEEVDTANSQDFKVVASEREDKESGK